METAESPIWSASKTSGWAFASLVTALTCVSPLAIIFGHIAISRIKNSAGQLTGFGIALTGTILGYLGLLVWFLSFNMEDSGSTKHKERTICILNIRNVQQAVRGHQNMASLKEGDPIDWDLIFGPDGYLKKPTCPTGSTYTFSKVHPQLGQPSCTCSHADHVPPGLATW